MTAAVVSTMVVVPGRLVAMDVSTEVGSYVMATVVFARVALGRLVVPVSAVVGAGIVVFPAG